MSNLLRNPWLAVGLVALGAVWMPARAAEPAPTPDYPVAAEAPPDPPGSAKKRADDVVSGRSALVISGGTSLGVYEAGVLYYYTLLQAQGRSRETAPFSVVGGTSAGAINAFFSAIATCESPRLDPRTSPFWVWTEIDWNDLMDGARPPGECGLGGALSRKPIRDLIPHIAARWRTEAWRTCDVRFGAAVTHLTPRLIPLREGASVYVRQLAERFALQLKTPANAIPGTPPEILSFPGGHGDLAPMPVLADLLDEPTEANREQRVGAVMELLLASSGIPGAFDPIPLRVKYPDRPVRRDCFIDGGVLDNVPLSTTIRLMGADADGDPNATYVYEDADNTEPPPHPPASVGAQVAPAAAAGEPGDVSRRVKINQLLADLVTGARQAELARTLEQKSARASLELPFRKHFITGETFAAFGAFFDASFRRYDILAGMADAEHYVSRIAQHAPTSLPQIASDELPCFRAVWKAELPEDVHRALAGSECAPLRVPPSDQSKEAKIRRDLWRLLKIIGPGQFDRAQPDKSRRFLEALASVSGPPGAGWTDGYEYITLQEPAWPSPYVAGPRSGLAAVRAQLNRLSARVASKMDFSYRPIVATAGRELVRSMVGYEKVPVSLSFGMYGRGGEVALARRLFFPFTDAVFAAQLADYGLRGKAVRGYSDLRVAAGLRGELNFGTTQLLAGGFVVQQAGLAGHHHPLYRLGFSGRLEFQALQRVYLGGAYTRFGTDATGWRQHDISLTVGLRFWL